MIPFSFYHQDSVFDCTKQYALAAPFIGFSPGIGETGVFTGFLCYGDLLLSSHAALLSHRRLATGPFFFLCREYARYSDE